MLPKITTTKIHTRKIVSSDTEVILDLFNESPDQSALLWDLNRNEEEAASIAAYSDIPPGGIKEKLRSWLLFEKNKQELVGVLEAYLGYPDELTAHIGLIYIRKKWQRQGIGHELISQLEYCLKVNGFTVVELAVGATNKVAQLFWSQLNYDAICDNDMSHALSSDKLIKYRKVLQ